jgi:hypothetical protein
MVRTRTKTRYMKVSASSRLEKFIRQKYGGLQTKLARHNVKIRTQIVIKDASASSIKASPGPVLQLTDYPNKTLPIIHMWVLIVQPSEAMNPLNVAWDVYNCHNHSSGTAVALLYHGIPYNIRFQHEQEGATCIRVKRRRITT